MASPGAGGGPREFFAVRAARWLGAAAQKAGASIARAVAGQSAPALRADLERRAAGAPETLEGAVAEWARLLAAGDDTPRYEDPGGGPALTFRAAFLGCEAFELLLASMAGAAGGDQATDARGASKEVVSEASWRAFLRGVALPGAEDAAARLPQLLALARHFPDCRRRVEETAGALKAEARHEVAKSRCAQVGTRAEEIRSALRSARRGGGGSPEEHCASSAEAVRLYASFREGLAESAAHLRGARAERAERLRAAADALRRLGAEAEGREAAAQASMAEAERLREEALAAPRRAAEEAEREGQRLGTDAKVSGLEAQRKTLQMELEEVSQQLATKRQEQATIQQRREEALKEHRQRTAAVEQELQELRPATFHGVVSPRAGAMTEGEIVAGLARASAAVADLARRAAEAHGAAGARRSEELVAQGEAVRTQAADRLRRHAQLELERLEAAGAAVADGVSPLLDFARRRAELYAMGVPDVDGAPDRRDVRRLRRALLMAKDAWEETLSFWSDAGGDGGIAAVHSLLPREQAEKTLQDLESARGRISQCLVPLQQADPLLYELAVAAGEEDMDDAIAQAAGRSAELPHGWETHEAPNGDVYYHNLVSQQTQWEPPVDDAAVCAGWRLCQAEDGGWFYHNPYDGQGIWWPELPTYAASPDSLDDLRNDVR